MAASTFKIHVDVSGVRQEAKNLESRKNTLRDLLNQMQKIVQELEGTSWSSKASRQIKVHIDELTSKFNNQDETLDAFIKYLERVAQTYESNEETVHTNATKFKQ